MCSRCSALSSFSIVANALHKTGESATTTVSVYWFHSASSYLMETTIVDYSYTHSRGWLVDSHGHASEYLVHGWIPYCFHPSSSSSNYWSTPVSPSSSTDCWCTVAAVSGDTYFLCYSGVYSCFGSIGIVLDDPWVALIDYCLNPSCCSAWSYYSYFDCSVPCWRTNLVGLYTTVNL